MMVRSMSYADILVLRSTTRADNLTVSVIGARKIFFQES